MTATYQRRTKNGKIAIVRRAKPNKKGNPWTATTFQRMIPVAGVSAGLLGALTLSDYANTKINQAIRNAKSSDLASGAAKAAAASFSIAEFGKTYTSRSKNGKIFVATRKGNPKLRETLREKNEWNRRGALIIGAGLYGGSALSLGASGYSFHKARQIEEAISKLKRR